MSSLATRSTWRGSSVKVKDNTAFLSFPSERTCLGGGGQSSAPPASRIQARLHLHYYSFGRRFGPKRRTTEKSRSAGPWSNGGLKVCVSHSPNTEHPVAGRPREEVEAVAVGRPCRGEAQSRHGCRVTCEPLKGPRDGSH